uniref:Uncharacterized protein K0048F05.9 n=1 Tax=Oryza sativa subsp. indica TaxID=39946 RepID=C8TF00_ORYSI|nr:hypothetical protein [Oryza sativa Indica Group]
MRLEPLREKGAARGETEKEKGRAGKTDAVTSEKCGEWRMECRRASGSGGLARGGGGGRTASAGAREEAASSSGGSGGGGLAH